MVACDFFFIIPELPSKFAKVNNALHKHWLTNFKALMQVSDFDEAPVDFDEQESDWFKANFELIISRL